MNQQLPKTNELEEYQAYFQKHPVEWVEEVFGEQLWEAQRQILISLRDNKRTAARSCFDIGKSFISARAVLWFLYSFPHSKVITTAPTWRQVERILWSEIRVARSKSRIFLPGNITNTSLKIGDDWYAIGMSTDDPDKFQGFHAVNILLVVDEASGVSEDIYRSSEGVITSENARLLLIGNPTNVSGTFYHAFKQPNYGKVVVSAFDTPNFTEFGITLEDIRADTWREKMTRPLSRPYLITPEWVADKLFKWGEESPMWSAMVAGEFPVEGEDTLIPLSKIEAATRTPLEVTDDAPEKIGVDVARFGGDKTVFVYRKGSQIRDVRIYNHSSTMETAQHVSTFAQLYPNASIAVDVVGIGAGVFDRLQQILPNQEVKEANVGLPARDSERFINLRAEWYWGLRERFIQGDIDLTLVPKTILDDLMSELSTMKFKFTSRGQIQIESKEDMKKRGLHSPDIGDALMISFSLGRGTYFAPVLTSEMIKPISPAEYQAKDLRNPDTRKAAEHEADMAIIRAQRGW